MLGRNRSDGNTAVLQVRGEALDLVLDGSSRFDDGFLASV